MQLGLACWLPLPPPPPTNSARSQHPCARSPLAPLPSRYMHKYGLPDEGCQPYSGTDHHAFAKKGMERCPADKYWCGGCWPQGAPLAAAMRAHTHQQGRGLANTQHAHTC